MALIVQKYGGTSVKNTERITEVAKKIVDLKRAGNQIVVVLSAQGGRTDKLIAKAMKITKNPPKRELDALLATGEQISIALFAMAVHSLGENVISLNATQLGIRTSNDFNSAQILDINKEKIEQELESGKIVVVAGFQGIDNEGNITTLGRGGSDTSAVAIGIAIDADEIEIYTDVDGIYSADPRVVKNAKKWDEVSYSEMIEMAGNGAKVLHTRSVELACKYNKEIKLRSSYTWKEGSIVKGEDSMESQVIRGISHSKNLAKLTLKNTQYRLANIINAFSKVGINIDMITHNVDSKNSFTISCILKNEDSEKALEIAKKEFFDKTENIELLNNLGKVSIIGLGVKSRGVAGKVFDILFENNILIELVSSSEINISCVIKEEKLIEAVQVLHKSLIEEEVINEKIN